jgi:hypothetical protein
MSILLVDAYCHDSYSCYSCLWIDLFISNLMGMGFSLEEHGQDDNNNDQNEGCKDNHRYIGSQFDSSVHLPLALGRHRPRWNQAWMIQAP